MHDKMKTYLTAFAPLHSAVVSQRQVAVNDDDGPSPDEVAARAGAPQHRPGPAGRLRRHHRHPEADRPLRAAPHVPDRGGRRPGRSGLPAPLVLTWMKQRTHFLISQTMQDVDHLRAHMADRYAASIEAPGTKAC